MADVNHNGPASGPDVNHNSRLMKSQVCAVQPFGAGFVGTINKVEGTFIL